MMANENPPFIRGHVYDVIRALYYEHDASRVCCARTGFQTRLYRGEAYELRMNLAVILVNWRNENETAACARAVKGWRTLAPQVLVVDNESSEATRNALAPIADELISSPVNLGYGGGNNLAIRRALAAGRNYILLINSDAEISEDATRRMIERLEANRKISILGPVIHERRGTAVAHLIGGRDIARHPSTRIATQTCDLRSIPSYPLHQVDYVPGTVLLARSRAFEEVGLLDDHYFFSGEIADFCKRARNNGHGVCVDLEAEARHTIDDASSPLRDTLHAYYSLRNRTLYVRKHHAAQSLRYLIWWGVVGVCRIASALARANLPKARAILLALKDGYTGRYGNQNARFT
jgi:GT2 family glycosyltransferase